MFALKIDRPIVAAAIVLALTDSAMGAASGASSVQGRVQMEAWFG
jgi:hypothetical protein